MPHCAGWVTSGAGGFLSSVAAMAGSRSASPAMRKRARVRSGPRGGRTARSRCQGSSHSASLRASGSEIEPNPRLRPRRLLLVTLMSAARGRRARPASHGRSELKPDGIVLDLQVIRPNPTVEIDERVFCEIDGELALPTPTPHRRRRRSSVPDGWSSRQSTTTTCASTTRTARSPRRLRRQETAAAQLRRASLLAIAQPLRGARDAGCGGCRCDDRL